MRYIKCPYCNANIDFYTPNLKNNYVSYETHTILKSIPKQTNDYAPTCICITFIKCPYCNEYIIYANGMGTLVKDINVPIKPFNYRKNFPDYIPKPIIEDYNEACDIVNLSPKASATLSRRCLQGMIHDVWNIKLKNLNQEITALKPKIELQVWNAIDSLRQIGNIGAHMEKDVNTIVSIEPNEAILLIKLIEYLFQKWYIEPKETSDFLSSIETINKNKQIQRVGKTSQE